MIAATTSITPRTRAEDLGHETGSAAIRDRDLCLHGRGHDRRKDLRSDSRSLHESFIVSASSASGSRSSATATADFDGPLSVNEALRRVEPSPQPKRAVWPGCEVRSDIVSSVSHFLRDRGLVLRQVDPLEVRVDLEGRGPVVQSRECARARTLTGECFVVSW